MTKNIAPRVSPSVLRRDIFTIAFTTFVIESGRGLFIASLWGMVQHVGGGQKLNSALVAVFSVGRLVAALLCGYLVDFLDERKVVEWFLLLGIAANLTYLLAYKVPEPWLVVVARIGTGAATGPLSAMRAGTAKLTTPQQRTKYMAINGAAQFSGAAMAPIIHLGVVHLQLDHSLPPCIGWLFNPLAAPATILIVLNLICVLTHMYVWIDPDSLAAQPSNVLRNGEHLSATENGMLETTPLLADDDDIDGSKAAPPEKQLEAAGEQHDWNHIVLWGSLMYILLNFVGRGVIALIEVLGTPLYLDMLGKQQDVMASSLLFAYLGMAGLLMFGAILVMEKYVHEAVLMIVGFVCLLVGDTMVAIHGNTSMAWLVGALGIIWSCGFPLLATTIVSSFSKILGSKPQGFLMGWLGVAGSLGRIAMPALTGIASSTFCFAFAAVESLVCIMLVVTYMAVVRHLRRRKAEVE